MATHKTPYFFSASQSVDNHLGKTFSFIWASYAGLRELWWQVRGFDSNFPNLHISTIEQKFFSGLPLPERIDLKHICLNTEWNKHEQEFCKWLLFDACTIYEGWAEKVCHQVFSNTHADKCSKQIQFPNGTNPNGNQTGFMLAIQRANQSKSTFIVTEFFPSLSAGKFNKWSSIDELLKGYRFFKECRNSFIHSDGLITSEIISTHQEFDNVLQTNSNLIKGDFTIPIGHLGEKIVLNVKDIILFTRLIKHLIATFDAALCVSANCERVLEDRLNSLKAINNKWQSLPLDQTKRTQRIHRMLTASRIPEPANVQNVDAWMVSKGIIS